MSSQPSLRSATVPTDWTRALARALRGDGVTTHFQAIVDLQGGSVVGHEALMRFPGHAIASPAAWLEAAHAHGCGAELEAIALHTALAARDRLPADAFLSVNVAPGVLSHPAVREALHGAGSLAGVVVELTEHARVEHYGVLATELDRLRAAGATIAVDDTGAGYAGLHHLLSIRPEMIKLDRTLIAGIDRDRPQRALVEMLRSFASRFGAWVVAEGVETAEELATLRRLDVPLAQGYLLGRPGPGWQSLSAEAGAHLGELSALISGPTLRLLLEPVGRLPVRGADRPPLHLPVDTGLVEAAHRAMSRDEHQRFDPLICTDTDGTRLGMVRMEQLVEQLALMAR